MVFENSTIFYSYSESNENFRKSTNNSIFTIAIGIPHYTHSVSRSSLKKTLGGTVFQITIASVNGFFPIHNTFVRGQNLTCKCSMTNGFRAIYYFYLIFESFRKLTETSGNLRRNRFFKASNDILHYKYNMSRSWKISYKRALRRTVFETPTISVSGRKHPETSQLLWPSRRLFLIHKLLLRAKSFT